MLRLAYLPTNQPIYSLIIILVVEHQPSSLSLTAELPARPETIRYASAPITLHQQDSNGWGNTGISIIQSIADHMEIHGDEESNQYEREDSNGKENKGREVQLSSFEVGITSGI